MGVDCRNRSVIRRFRNQPTIFTNGVTKRNGCSSVIEYSDRRNERNDKYLYPAYRIRTNYSEVICSLLHANSCWKKGFGSIWKNDGKPAGCKSGSKNTIRGNKHNHRRGFEL